MAPEPAPLFQRLGPDRFAPTHHSRGPWDHRFLHGGPVCGLLGHVAETEVGGDADLLCSRLTVDLLRMVPLEPLTARTRTVKPGRRSRVVDVELILDAGTVVARASSQWINHHDNRSVPLGTPDDPPPARPATALEPQSADLDYPRPGFNCDAAELRPLVGNTEESGPGIVWARLTASVVEGEPVTPFTMVATLSDLAAAVGWERSKAGTAFVNPDVTLQLIREPEGPWVGLEARNHHAAHQVGTNEATLWDDHGRFGWVLQSLVESPIPVASDPST
ncbi:MAG: thioesterase family protein [Actinomycetia bacterium]|nr:thioesterase family protein [Actinomycetes bacterium]